jgi:hypothetical protein
MRLHGHLNGKWKGGVRTNSDGYLQITAGPLRGKYVHILILEAKLGRKLRPDEEAHHLNCNRLDCRPENLEPRAIDGPEGHRDRLNGRPWWVRRRHEKAEVAHEAK